MDHFISLHRRPTPMPPQTTRQKSRPVKSMAEDAAECNRRMRAVGHPHAATGSERTLRIKAMARVLAGLHDGDTAEIVAGRLGITVESAANYLRQLFLAQMVERTRQNATRPYLYTKRRGLA